MSTAPFVLFWIGDECVHTEYDSGLIPRLGDIVALRVLKANGLFKVKEVLWVFETTKCVDPFPDMHTNKIEIHLIPKLPDS